MKKIVTVIAIIALVALLGTMLFACTPSGVKKATKKLEKADYTVTTAEIPEEYKKVGVDGYIEARKGDDYLEAIHFDTLKNARAFRKDHDEDFNEKQSTYAAAFGNVSIQRIGKWIVLGTEEAINAFKK